MAGDQGVIQCVVQHGVVQSSGTAGGDIAHAVAHTCLGQHEGSLGHVLNANDQTDLGLAQHNVVAGDLHSTHTGSAVLVHGDSGALDGQANAHGDLTCGQGALHVGIALAHDDLVDQVDVNACTGDGFLTGVDSQLTSGHVLELTLELTNGSTACADDNDFSHLRFLLLLYLFILH